MFSLFLIAAISMSPKQELDAVLVFGESLRYEVQLPRCKALLPESKSEFDNSYRDWQRINAEAIKAGQELIRQEGIKTNTNTIAQSREQAAVLNSYANESPKNVQISTCNSYLAELKKAPLKQAPETAETTSSTTQQPKKLNNARDILFPSARTLQTEPLPIVATEKPKLLNAEQTLQQCEIPKLLKCLTIKKTVCLNLITESVSEANSAAEYMASHQSPTKEELANTSMTKFMVYMSLKTNNKYMMCLSGL